MQTYIGVERVQAEPQERDGKRGYRVIHEPNGYENWCPKEIFESKHLPICEHNKLTPKDITGFLRKSETTVRTMEDGKTTLVGITAPTGWVDWDTSTCVSAENYDVNIGKKIALEHIKTRLWMLLGFVLQWADRGLKSGDDTKQNSIRSEGRGVISLRRQRYARKEITHEESDVFSADGRDS